MYQRRGAAWLKALKPMVVKAGRRYSEIGGGEPSKGIGECGDVKEI